MPFPKLIFQFGTGNTPTNANFQDCETSLQPFSNSETKHFKTLQGSWKVEICHMVGIENLNLSNVEVWEAW